MKTKLLLLVCAIFGLTFAACDDDDDDVKPQNVPESITKAFEAKYPSVKNPSWEREGQYYVAEWQEANGGRELEAWFRPDVESASSWAMTNTDFGKDLFLVPAGLNAAFNKTEYATSPVDDIDLYEYPDASRNVYVIEVSPAGQAQDIWLVFNTSDYSLVKTMPEPTGTITPDTQI